MLTMRSLRNLILKMKTIILISQSKCNNDNFMFKKNDQNCVLPQGFSRYSQEVFCHSSLVSIQFNDRVLQTFTTKRLFSFSL